MATASFGAGGRSIEFCAVPARPLGAIRHRVVRLYNFPSIKSNVDFCSTFRNRVMTVRTALCRLDVADKESAK